MRARRRTAAAGALGLALVLAVLATSVAPAGAYPDAPRVTAPDGACEGEVLRLHNTARTSAGLPALREDPSFDDITRGWALRVARAGALSHNPNFGRQIVSRVPSMRRATENVGYAPSALRVHNAFMASPGHKANILDRNVQRVAVGCVRDGNGRYWVAVNFVGATAAFADRRPTPFWSAGDASARLRWWLLAAGPDGSRLESDSARLLGGAWSAADLAVYLAGSSTHTNLVPGTVRLYGAAFDRNPDAPGLVYWAQQRQQGLSLSSIASRFVGSREFTQLYGSLGDRAFVEQIYRNVLDREPDASGTDYWVGRLRAGATRGTVLLGFSESPENRNRTAADVTVSWAFAQLIARMPTGAERTQWTGWLRAGGSQDALVRFLVASDAFARRAAANSY